MVVTLPPENVSFDRSTLNAGLDSQGLATTVWFEWGTDTNYGNTTAVTNLGSGSGWLLVSHVITGLTPGLSYHYHAVGSNSAGVATGSDEVLTTALFTDIGAGWPGVRYSSVAWGDYDHDGDLGPATPRYEFTDTNAPALPQRFYRLRWP